MRPVHLVVLEYLVDLEIRLCLAVPELRLHLGFLVALVLQLHLVFLVFLVVLERQ
ncbi:hypothetical protein KV679_16160 [Bacillus sp. JRC01]|nr:hypothetical protein [Bacillus sp. JRC01]